MNSDAKRMGGKKKVELTFSFGYASLHDHFTGDNFLFCLEKYPLRVLTLWQRINNSIVIESGRFDGKIPGYVPR